ncbi:thiol-activated cytolysin family protein [Streptantibioticus rubrisoli]
MSPNGQGADVKWRAVEGANRYALTRLDDDQVIAEAATPSFTMSKDQFAKSFNGTPRLHGVVAYQDERPIAFAVAKPLKDPNAPADMDSYLLSLSSWKALTHQSDDHRGPIGTPKVSAEKEGSEWVRKSGQSYSLTRTPDKIVSFNPNVDALWPGALVQSRGAIDQGVLSPLSIRERAPLNVTVDALNVSQKSSTVPDPDSTNVLDAIKGMVRGQSGGSSATFYDVRDSASVKAMALEMGVSGHYLGFEAQANLDYKKKSEENTVLAYFEERAFSAFCSAPTTPAGWFTKRFTQGELDYLENAGSIGRSNPPLYVSSVTYGRVLMFTCTYTASAQEIVAAVKASYEGAAGGASGNLDVKSSEILRNSHVQVVTIGGDPENARALIKSGKVGDYFATQPTLDKYQPMSFVLRRVVDNKLAQMSETYTYTEYHYDKLGFTFTLELLSIDQPRSIILREGLATAVCSVDGIESTARYEEEAGRAKLVFPQGIEATRSFSANPVDPANSPFQIVLGTQGIFNFDPVEIRPDPTWLLGRRQVDRALPVSVSVKIDGKVNHLPVTFRYRLTMTQPSEEVWPSSTTPPAQPLAE